MSKLPSLVDGKTNEQISVQDRGLLYGQTVFETILVHDKSPLLLDAHLQRLARGCEVLSIPCNAKALEREIKQLSQDLEAGVLRAMLSMGKGGRGYQNPEKPSATRILTTHSLPDYPQEYWKDGITLGLSDIRLSSQSVLAGIKHGNRLEQVLARNGWQEDWQEALLLDQQQYVIEGTQSNVFIVRGETLLTPDLSRAGVNGVMREFVIEQAKAINLEVEIVRLSLADIKSADEIFMTNSIIGLWPVNRFGSKQIGSFPRSHELLKLMRDHGAIPSI